MAGNDAVSVTAPAGAHRAQRAVPKGRADAARNRERIVAAAREAFVIHGADVPLDDVARSAGVGNATLYRHFADRDTLVHAVVLDVTHRISDRAEEALHAISAHNATGDFAALRRFAFAAVEERIGALCPLLSDRFGKDDPELLDARRRLEALTEDLVGAARRSGELRPDVDVGDLMVALSQLTRPLPGTGCAEIARFVDRHVQVFLDGLQTPARSELPGHAATLEELQPRP